MPDFARDRDRMVDVQIVRRGIRDRCVLDAMRRVPRDAFVEPGFEEFGYEDIPLPIGGRPRHAAVPRSLFQRQDDRTGYWIGYAETAA
jgi:protein-L-isoaspartate O-methyltransferase